MTKPRFEYEETPTNIEGLKFLPKLLSKQDNEDFIEMGWINDEYVNMTYKHQHIVSGFSDLNKKILTQCVDKLFADYRLDTIVEIGISANREHSSTMHLLGMKPDDTKYLGIDRKSDGTLREINNSTKNSFVLQEDSSNIDSVMDYAKRIAGITNIDLLLIDGFHSINQVIKEWRYTNYLKEGGMVLFHDTNYHPGPYCIFEAIDENLYNKTKYYEEEEFDWGVAVAEKKEK
jgi:hypothetical protein